MSYFRRWLMSASYLTEEDRNRYYAVIMAGGGGTRLWPWSRRGQTKQMLRITGERSMFQITIDRIRDLISADNMLVITTKEQAGKLEEQDKSISHENYILEPMPRGTASVVGMAAIQLLSRNKNAVMAILTADHFIRNEAYFRSLLESAFLEAEKGHLVTLGIEPTFPSTGMGYIEQGDFIENEGGNAVHRVSRFCEKPDHDTAVRFLKTGLYSWNSGMFIWRADRILDEIKNDLPDLYEKLMRIYPTIGTPDYEKTLAEIWPTIQPQTIDYGVMEKASDVVVLPAKGLGWNDIGSWESLFDVLDADDKGNIHINCRSLHLDSKGVLSCSDNKDKMIITVGMENVVVVETENAVLVCPKNDTQRVKEIVQYLKDHDLDLYL